MWWKILNLHRILLIINYWMPFVLSLPLKIVEKKFKGLALNFV
jgi:hypothetical protein